MPLDFTAVNAAVDSAVAAETSATTLIKAGPITNPADQANLDALAAKLAQPTADLNTAVAGATTPSA